LKIAVVTDSASDIPADEARRLDIRVVPCIVVISDQDYEDGPGLSRAEFYRMLPGMSPPPTTAAPSIGMFESAYRDALGNGYDAVLSIHPPVDLSGIINAASAAAESFDGRVRVFDSRQASMGLGFQVLAAAEKASEGASFEELIAYIEGVQSRVRVLAMLDTLTYLQRSGRVSWLKANLGSILSIRTFIELSDGRVKRLDQIRTRRKGIAHLTDLILNLPPLEKLAVLHSGAEGDAAELARALAPQVGVDPLIINITTIIGAHVGPNGLGCAAVLKRP
jgi:DegV family protein with EDD domain